MAVRVNGTLITDEAIEAEFQSMRSGYEKYVKAAGGSPDLAVLRAWARENLIERTLLVQEARRRAGELGREETAEGDDAARDRRLLEALLDRLAADVQSPTESELRRHHRANRKAYLLPERVHASHIVKHVGAADGYRLMLNVREQLRRGACFDDLARQHSDCPDRGGDLGVFARGQMVEEFDDVVFALRPGETSDVFQTSFGYHVAKVHARYPSSPAPFSAAREAIHERVTMERRQESVAALADRLRAVALIEDLPTAPPTDGGANRE